MFLAPVLRKCARALVLAFAAVCLWWGAASAHAVVFPAEAPTGAYQRYVLRVPNERQLETTRVAITFPGGVRVISFDVVPGWTLETTSGAEAGSVATAVWSGTLPVGRFVELGFIGVNPESPTSLQWDVVQTYADGTEVAWTGPEGSSTPASVTQVIAPAEAEPSDAPSSLGILLGGTALLVAMTSLGLSLRAAKPS